MIASLIGRKFLETYNRDKGLNLSPREFFGKKYIPLFFDHPKYMMTGGNAPLENPKIQWKKGKFPNETERKDRIQKTIDKIERGVFDASIAIGFPASEEKKFATTSGQVTNINYPLNKDDVYCSWIGSGLGIGIAGGYSIFFDHPQILMVLYEGWHLYRSYLSDSAYGKLKGNQIDTWNGQWLSHAYSDDYFPEDPIINFEPFETTKNGIIQLKTQSWVKVVYGIALQFPDETMTGYIYSLGQMNKTVGFIPFRLPRIRKPFDLYRKLFGEDQYLKDSKKIEELFGTAFSFRKACQLGAIGVQALEPKGLKDFIPQGQKNTKMPQYKNANEDQIITFNTYISWILAMLNNEELWETAGKAAETFLSYEKGGKKTTTIRTNNVKSILTASHRRAFIDALTTVLNDDEKEVSAIVELGKIVNTMPASNFPYFLTLIRFRYAEMSNNK